MAEKSLSQTFGTGVKMELKIGKSFEKKGSSNSVYHTIKYDFKPVSVDENQMGLLEVQEARSVSVGLPHLDGSGQTNYKGNAKPANSKECILIIDHETGELTLERLDSQIMLKKTRPERPDKSLNSFELPTGKTASNPFEVREKPSNPFEVREKPQMPTANPFEVREKPQMPTANPFEVLEKPLMTGRPRPHTPQSAPRPQTPQERPSNRPHTPQHKQKKKSPQYSNGMGFKDSLPDMSPLHSNKSSPACSERSARSSPKRTEAATGGGGGRVSMGGGLEVDSLGRPLPLSDSSNSSDSSSGSDSDSGPEEDDTAIKPAAAPPAKQESTHSSKASMPSSHPSKASMPSSHSSKASMPGTNLSMPGAFDMPGSDFSMPSGVVAKPRADPPSDFDPTSRRSRSTKRPTERSSAAPAASRPTPPAESRPTPPAASRPAPPVPHRPTPPSKASMPGAFDMPGSDFSMPSMSAPAPSMSMPNFADLGDDLALSDSD